MGLTVDEAVAQLGHRQSQKRRAAAKALRKAAAASAGPAVFDALQTEVRDPRTWETQYQMVMAVGECNHKPARSWLMEFAQILDDPLAVGAAVGDAVVRLSDDKDAAVEWVLGLGKWSVLDGALRALAMTRILPNHGLMKRVLNLVDQRPLEDGLRYWVAVAALDWPKDEVTPYLERWAALSRDDVATAAKDSLAGYRRPQRPL